MEWRLASVWKDERGVIAIEFALVMPAFLTLIVAIIYLSLFGLTLASLHYAVEESARCRSIRTNCPEPKTYYFAPGPTPVFTSTNAACGFSQRATVTFTVEAVLYRTTIPLSAAACFP